jgi:hypothetical protein
MLYALLCYHQEDVVCGWSREEDEAVMAKLDAAGAAFGRAIALANTAAEAAHIRERLDRLIADSAARRPNPTLQGEKPV